MFRLRSVRSIPAWGSPRISARGERSGRRRWPPLLVALLLLATVLFGVPGQVAQATIRPPIARQQPMALATPQPTIASGPAPSLMVQVSTLVSFTPAHVDAWLQAICADTRPKTIALQDVATSDGLLATAYLDVIVPYLPGGTRPCFTRAFVGTADLVWTGSGSKYSEGVQDVAFRSRYLSLSRSVANAFRSRYPQVRAGWYLTYEANLNELFYPAVQNAYKTLLASEIQLLNDVRPGAIMWSPAFWYPFSTYSQNTLGMSQLRTMLSDLFKSVRVQVLDLQDFVAGSACQPAWNRVMPSDAASWVGFLSSLGKISDVEVNSELFAFDCARGVIGPGDAQEIMARRAFYASRQLTLGPAFELRYWMQTQPSV